jgi:signal transduction histidine kinase
VFANVVKHASATRVTVRTWSADHVIYLAVEDNGVGMPPPEERGHGRGLGNIRVRAEKIGAHIRYYSAWPGTGVEFAFQMQDPDSHSNSAWPPIE